METKDLIARDIDSLYRKLYISSNSKKELYSRDFSSISILNQMINGIQLDNPFPINRSRLLSEEILNGFEKLYSISLGAIKGYQKMDFKLFEGMDTNLSMSDKKDTGVYQLDNGCWAYRYKKIQVIRFYIIPEGWVSLTSLNIF